MLLFALQDTELPNVLPESPQEQTVDFSIDLVDPGYRELLDDPDSPQYVDLAHHLQEQVSASREPAGLALTWAQNFLFPQSVLLVKELRAHGHTGRAGPGRAEPEPD